MTFIAALYLTGTNLSTVTKTSPGSPSFTTQAQKKTCTENKMLFSSATCPDPALTLFTVVHTFLLIRPLHRAAIPSLFLRFVFILRL